MKKVNLNLSLDSVSLDAITNLFKLEPTENGVCGFDAYGGPEFVYFFNSGKAIYTHTGKLADALDFDSHQDCSDFIRIK